MLGDFIKQRRVELGLSQEQFSIKLQLAGYDSSRTAISSWEIKRYQVPIHDPQARRAIAAVLRVTEEELLANAGLISTDSLSDAARHAASIVNNLPRDKQDLAINLLLTLEKGELTP